jgi:methionyl aminopeptidase
MNLWSKGDVLPELDVPKNIQKPDYVWKKKFESEPWKGSEIRTQPQIEKIKSACKIASTLLDELNNFIKPGISTDDIDKFSHKFIIDHGAYPSTLGYRNFPKSICTSVNNVVVHGIPDSYILQNGDIINVDVTVYKNGYHGDTSRTYLVGNVDNKTKLFVQRTKDAMYKGIDIAKVGRPFNIIGKVIENYVNRFGYSVVREYTGHSIGRAFHGSIIVPNYDSAPAYNNRIEENMVFTIEPMVNMGKRYIKSIGDGWTEITSDNSLSAQFEHTILMTSNGAEVLT